MIYTHLAAAVIAALATWFFQDNHYSTQIAEMRLEHTQEVTGLKNDHAEANRLAGEEFQRIYAAMTDKYQGALNDARTREANLRRDNATASSESDGLRAQLTDAARRIAAAPPSSLAEYATATGELLVDCSRSYQELAGKADGHTSDVRTLVEAWPVKGP